MIIRLVFLSLLWLSGAGSAWATMPATYASFVEVTIEGEPGGALIKNKLENETGVTALYLGPGDYFIENPVVINRTGSIYIHGAGRTENTKLIALDPTQPLFQIDAATVVNFANLNLYATLDWTPCPPVDPEGDPCVPVDLEARAVLMNNTLPATLEIQFSDIYSSFIDIKGPGTVRLESTIVRTNGLARTGILVDHPDAEFISVGGGYTGGVERAADPALLTDYDTLTPVDPNDPHRKLDFYHVWARQGRAQIYTASNTHALGRADFRFDSASVLGPHVVAHLRSEFANPPTNEYEATIAYVPPRTLPIEVLLKANGVDAVPQVPAGAFIDYNAEGTVWLLGNSSRFKATFVAKGDAPNATIIAIGNKISTAPGSPLFDTTATRVAFAHNMGFPGGDVPKFMNPSATLASFPGLPEPPRIDIVPPIARPQLTEAFRGAGMVDVTDPTYGATPNDDSNDDLPAIQAALDASCDYDAEGNATGTEKKVGVFIPAGTYHVSGPLQFNIAAGVGVCSDDPTINDCTSDSDCQGAGTCEGDGTKTVPCLHSRIGGWIAGEGKDLTRIVNVNGGTVFRSDSIKRVLIQGISFETDPYDPATELPAEGAVVLDFAPTDQLDDPVQPQPPPRPDTSSVSFYDVRFDGGISGASVGIASGAACSETMFVDSEFRNSHIGFRNGGYNALNNITYASHFEDNAFAAGITSWEDQKAGGNWGMYSTTIRNSGIRDFHFASPRRTYYFLNLDTDSDSSGVSDSESTPGHLITFDASHVARPEDFADEVFSIQYTGGYTFLHTSVSKPSNIVLKGEDKNGEPTNSYSVSLWSDISDHADSVAEVPTAGHIDETTTDGDGVSYFDDNCPFVANDDQVNEDQDAAGLACDAFDSDPTETSDFDGDGIGDNADTDDDDDGVADAAENAGPNAGDANADGTADSLQFDVASLPDLGGAGYLTLEVSGGCQEVKSVTLEPEDAIGSEDPYYDYPNGLVGFTLPCTSADVKVYFHIPAAVTAPYRKYGPTTPGDASTNAWYDLTGAVFGSETIGGAVAATVSFTLSDGQPGDATAVDGQIMDPGGPAIPVIPMNSYDDDLAANGSHTCAIEESGVRCWGLNNHGQAMVPAGLDNPSAVAAGDYHTCAIDAGNVICWGFNGYGQATVPEGLGNPTAVTAGFLHTCALEESGITCWGDNSFGQSAVPSDLVNPREVAAGLFHTCALDDYGVSCWGLNDDGQATDPTGLVNPRAVAAGNWHSCAIDANGVACWGHNLYGQATVPLGLVNPSAVVAGDYHTCAIDGGNIICWGRNNFGQTSVPASMVDPVAVATGSDHSCALHKGGVTCWGFNAYGQATVPTGLVFNLFPVASVPALSPFGLSLLVFGLLLGGRLGLRRRCSRSPGSSQYGRPGSAGY